MLPIDLQTLYTQLDKIGKTQVQHQLAAQTVQEAQILENKNKTLQNLQTVQQFEAGDEKTGVVHERTASEKQMDANFREHPKAGFEKKGEEEPEIEKEIITDPALGAHIDISG